MAPRDAVDRMADVVSSRVWDELAPSLSPFEYGLLTDTRFYVDEKPKPADLQAAGVPPGGHLLGLFTAPPATITLYADEILAVGADPTEIAVHELGHRFGYDHSRYEAAVALLTSPAGETGCVGCAPPMPLTQVPQPPPQDGYSAVIRWRDNCPVCLLHARLAEADRLLAGLSTYATLQHRIPDGLGGTIPLAAHKVAEAVSLCQIVEALVPERTGDVRLLRATLDEAQAALDGWLDVDGVNRAYRIVHRAWQEAYLVAWDYFAAHP